MRRLSIVWSAVSVSAVFACIVAAPARAATLPLAHYAMEEGPPEATQTADAQGGTAAQFNGAMGAASWTNTYLAPVPAGTTQALIFDKRDPKDFLDVPGFKGVTGTNARTVSAWINTTNPNANILSWGQNSGGKKWTFRVQDANGQDGAIRVEVNGGYQVGSTRVDDGRWHHVAAVWQDDGSPDVQDVQLYVDGQLEAISASQSRSINTASNADVRIGQDFNGNRTFNGVMDDVRVYSAALSGAEIAQLAGPDGGRIAPVLIYDAAADPNVADNTWEDARGVYRPDLFQWSMSGVTHNPSPATTLPGIKAAYTFGAGDSASFGSQDFQDDFPGNLTDNSFATEVWFKPNDFSGQEVLVDLGGSGDGMSLTLNGSTLQLVAKDDAATAGVTTDLLGNGTNEFIQAVGVIDLENDLLSLYVDGELVGSAAYTGDDWAGTDNHSLGAKGGTVGGTGGYFGNLDGYGAFEGEVALVRFYGDALSAGEVEDAYFSVVPEPATMTLALLSLGGVGLAARRRRRRA